MIKIDKSYFQNFRIRAQELKVFGSLSKTDPEVVVLFSAEWIFEKMPFFQTVESPYTFGS